MIDMQKSKRFLVFIPLLILLSIVLLLLVGLNNSATQEGKSALGKPVPEFYLSDLDTVERTLTLKDLPQNQVYMLNVWGSWCSYCREELPLLARIAKQYHLPIVGIDYLDKRQNAVQLLKVFDNPYQLNIYDSQGKLVHLLGSANAPQTFLVDKKGIIRYYHNGMLLDSIWQNEIYPIVEQLNAE